MIRRFFHEEDGPTATEYAVMLALIIVVCMATITGYGGNLGNKYVEINDTMFP